MKPLAVTIGLIIAAATITAGSFAKRAADRHEISTSRSDSAGAGRAANEAAAVPVIVELFTSEGCSSCPPADALLARLETEQSIPGAEVLALEEHVDYWNQGGWFDVFSSSELTARQQVYADALRSGGPYTPQMVVDGQSELVGSRSEEARKAIAAASTRPRAEVSVARGAGGSDGQGEWTVQVHRLAAKSGDTAEVWLAVTETHLHSNVMRGENAGHDLAHAAVVRQLTKLGVADGGKEEAFSKTTKINFHKGWKPENLRVVAFVQEKNSRHILGGGSLKVVE